MDNGHGGRLTVPSVTFQQAEYGSMSGSAAECQTEKTLTRREISGLFFTRRPQALPQFRPPPLKTQKTFLQRLPSGRFLCYTHTGSLQAYESLRRANMS